MYKHIFVSQVFRWTLFHAIYDCVLWQVDEAVRVNGERDDDVHSINGEKKGGPERHREEDALQFFPSPSQHTEISASTHTHQGDTQTTEVSRTTWNGREQEFAHYHSALWASLINQSLLLFFMNALIRA